MATQTKSPLKYQTDKYLAKVRSLMSWVEGIGRENVINEMIAEGRSGELQQLIEASEYLYTMLGSLTKAGHSNLASKALEERVVEAEYRIL